jgi:cell wall-associated NlpC family hydrolase
MGQGSLLLYAPAVRLVIATDTGTYDVSADITSGSCSLVENSVNTMEVNLINRGRRYDRLFKPNDRFVLYLKRLQELLVMTGYLDEVPFFSIYPRTVPVSGSSTLKSLQYREWQPGNQASYDLLLTLAQGSQVGTTQYNDDGLAVKASALAAQVGGWDPSNIHFSSLPTTWVNQVKTLYNVIAPQLASEITATMGAVVGGSTASGGVTTTTSVLPDAPPGAEVPVSLPFGVPYQPASAANTFGSTSGQWYCQMQWTYQQPDGSVTTNDSPAAAQAALASQTLMVTNPDLNLSVVVSPASWGPSTGQGGDQIGLSPQALATIGLSSSGAVSVAWVTDPNVPLGPFNPSSVTTADPTKSTPGGQTIQANPNTGGLGAGALTQDSNANIAVAYAETLIGVPYVWGGLKPTGVDCSGLVDLSWSQAGVSIPRTTVPQYNALPEVPAPSSNWLPGDLLFYTGSDSPAPGHVKMYLGGNRTIEAPHTGAYVEYGTITSAGDDGTNSFMGARRVTSAYGASNPSGKLNTTVATAGGSVVPASDAAANSSSSTSSPLDLWSTLAQAPDPIDLALTGYRALMMDTPFLPMFQTICMASMRSFCNAPNGDIIAWFPDYFNQYNCLGVLEIQDIELEDFTMMWSDASMVTHQFVAGTSVPVSTLTASSVGGQVAFNNVVSTDGVATIDFPQILQTLFNIDNADPTFSTDAIYQRFGARTNYQGIGTIVSSLAEFWYALYLFQQNWASLFSTTIPIAFMPEAYPGMIMRIPSVGFQCYIERVDHSWNLSEGGGFKTSVSVVAPSSTTTAGLWGFAKAGQ